MNKDIFQLRKEAISLLPEILQILLIAISSDISFVRCRVKSVESINKKIEKFKINLSEVYDLIGFCIVVNDIDECYKTLEQIKNINEITINETIDYIKNPADANKYQAIHIRSKYKQFLLEIQIRSIEMNNKAERDYLAYKRGDFDV